MSDRTYSMILKLSWILAGLIIYFTSVCFKPIAIGANPMGGVNYTALASGNWTVSTTWAPGSVPPLIDNNNSDNFTIGSASLTCNVVTSSGVTFGGNTQSLYIFKGSSLTINGDVNISNSITITIEQGGTLVINGSLIFANGATNATINGEMDITGNLVASSNNSGSYGGTGYVQVGGTVTDPNGKFSTWRIDQNMRYAIASSNWTSDAGTWSNVAGGVIVTSPSTTSNVHIETNTSTNASYAVTMDGSSETVASLIVGANNTLTIQAGKSLNVTGSVTINGTLNILSDATGTGVLYTPSTITGTGTINIQRYCAGTQYHYISSPFSNTSTTPFVSVFNGTTEQFYYYDEAAYPANGQWQYGWTKVPTASTFTVGRGYALYYYPTTWSFSGTPAQLNQGSKTYALQFSGVDQGNANQSSKSWNLVGNPYMTTLDAKSFITANGPSGTNLITGTLYFWDVGGTTYQATDYASYNFTGGTASATAGKGGSTPNGNIEMGQGFVVSAKSSGNLSFTSSMQSSTASSHFFKSMSISGQIDKISIDLEDANGNGNNILIGMSDNATNSYTEGYDGLKRKGNANIAFYSIKDQKECAISCYPPSTTEFDVPLSFDTQVGGNMKISIFSLQNNAYSGIYYLVDSLLHKQMRCYPGVNYTINVPTGTTANRMYIKYIPPTLSVSPTTLSVAGDAGSSATFSVSSNTNWHIEAPSWIHLSTALGNGNQNVSITADENLSVYPHQGTINVVVNGMDPQVITVTQAKGKPFFAISPNLFQTASSANSSDISINANIPWTLTGLPSWINASKTSGDGSETISITASENPLAKARSASLLFNTNESLEATLRVQQDAAAAYLNLSTQSINLASESQTVSNSGSFSISSNTDWSIDAPSWIKLSSSNGSESQTISITASENLSVYPRQANITVKANGLNDQSINIIQEKGKAFFSISKTNFSSLAKSDKDTILISANIPWAITGLPDWLSANKTSGDGSDRLIVSVSENMAITARSASLIFNENESLTATASIQQAGAVSYLNLNTSTLSVSSESESVLNSASFSISSNTSWVIDAPAWIKTSTLTGEGDRTVNITLEENPTVDTRSAQLKVTGKEMDARLINIAQARGKAFFNVSPLNLSTSASANTETLVIRSNVPWSVVGTTNWLSANKTDGLGNGNVVLSAAENQTVNARSANLIFTASENLSANVNFAQVGAAPFLSLSTESVTLGSEAQTFSYTYTTNTPLDISIDQSWAVFGRTINGMSQTLKFNINQNTTANARTAHVGFSAAGITSKTLSITQSGITAIGEITDQSDIKIYPNPSTGTISINLNDPYRGVVVIKLKDLAGREMKTIKLDKTDTNWTQAINLESIANGFYILTIESNKLNSFNFILEK